jgi:hypothetical protein
MDMKDSELEPRSDQSSDTKFRTARPWLKKSLLTLLFIAGWGLFVFDLSAPSAWSLLVFGAGLFLAILVTPNPTPMHWTATILVLMAVPLLIGWRLAPVHSMEWNGIDRVEVERITGEDHFEITDPVELRELERFGARGTMRSMLKSGYGYHLRVWKDNVGTSHYVHGDAFGTWPGGFSQSIFVPSESGFMKWFEELLVRHGHPRR